MRTRSSAVLVVLALAACSKDQTQIVVRVDTDFAVPAELSSVHATVRNDAGELATEHDFDLPLPFSFGVTPGDSPLEEVVIIEVEARGPAFTGGNPFVRRAKTHFIAEKTLLLSMFLAKRCSGVTCELGNTCTESGCTPEEIPPELLPVIEPGQEIQPDGGLPPEDAGVEKGLILVEPTSGLVTEEGGATATFTVRLDRSPTSYVVVAVSSSNEAEATADNMLLTFTPLDWDRPKTVTVTGVDDGQPDGDQTYSIVLAPAESGDPAFEGVDPPDVSAVNIDDDQAALELTGSQGLSTTERGGIARFSVALAGPPMLDVDVDVSSSDQTEGVVSPAMLHFTTRNWDQPQQIQITGVDDAEADGPMGYTIVLDARMSPDPLYMALSPVSVTVTNADDETAGVTVTPALGLITTESGGNAEFTVVLNTRPSAEVTIKLASDQPGEGLVSPDEITFDGGNWSMPWTVIVTGVDDAVDDDDRAYSIVSTMMTADGEYAVIDPDDVGVTNADDDNAGIEISSAPVLHTSESGGTDDFTVRLLSEPTAEVVIDLLSSDPREGLVGPLRLTFSATNWATPQMVTVTGLDDDASDGDVPYQITIAAAVSADPKYDGRDAPDLSAINSDDDLANVELTAPGMIVVRESGATASLTVRLSTQPLANVTVAFGTATGNGDVAIVPDTVIFDGTDWNVTRTVVLSAPDDLLLDGDQNIAVNVGVMTTDPSYSMIDPPDLQVLAVDDGRIATATDISSPNGTPEGASVPSISADGTLVAFQSRRSDLVPNDTNGKDDVFVFSRATRAWRRVSVDSTGGEGNDDSSKPIISQDGRYVVFESKASNLAGGDGNSARDIFVHDLMTGQTTRVNLTSTGMESSLNQDSSAPGISADGRYVGWYSPFIFNVAFPTHQIWWRDLSTGMVEGAGDAMTTCTNISIDAAGRLVSFVRGTSPMDRDVILTDRGSMGGRTSIGTPSVDVSDAYLTPDGRWMIYTSEDDPNDSGDTNGRPDVFALDLMSDTVTLISQAASATPSNGDSDDGSCSNDGNFIAFSSTADNLAPMSPNGRSVYVADRMAGTITALGVDVSSSIPSRISGDGRFVTYQTTGDGNASAVMIISAH